MTKRGRWPHAVAAAWWPRCSRAPTRLAAITGEHLRGAKLRESDIHPFRRTFEELQIGDSLLTHRRTVPQADIVAFGGMAGDYFYMHFGKIAAKEAAVGKRIAHGYFVLSATTLGRY